MASTNVSFADVLDAPIEEIKAPPPTPAGTYAFLIDGQPEYRDVNTQNGVSKLVKFECKILEPQGDLANDPQAVAVVGRKVKNEYWLTDKSAFILKRFLTEHLGIDGTGKTLRQLVSEAPGQTFLGTLKLGKPDKSGIAYAEFASTAKA